MLRNILKSYQLLGFYKKYLFIIFLFFLLVSTLDLIGLSLIGTYITVFLDLDENLTSKIYTLSNSFFPGSSPIIVIGILIIFMFLIKLLLGLLVNFSIVRFSIRQMNDLRLKLLSGYQNQQYLDHKVKKTSDYIYNIVNLTAEFSVVVQSILKIFSEIILIIFIISFLSTKDFITLSILVSLVLAIFIIYDKIFKFKLKKYGKEINISSNSAINSIIETMNGLKQIRVLKKEDYFFEKIKNLLSIMIKAKEKSTIIQLSPRYIMEFILVFFVVLMSFVSVIKNYGNLSMLPNFGIFAFAAIRLLPSSNVILSSMSILRTYSHAIDVLSNDFLEIEKDNIKKYYKNPNEDLDVDFKNIIFNDVKFSYNLSKDYIFENINFTIKSGEAIGIIGPSGSGKSTLADLILGFVKPTAGKILFNNKIDLSINHDYLRKKSSYLPQNIFLINGSIKENIALGENKIDVEKIIESTKQSQLTNFVDNLEDKLETQIGESGTLVSGGQRQRIGLARSFYFDREILVFDEATNALDNETEKKIIDYLKSLKSKKTIIFISHNEKLLGFCDKIYQISDKSIKLLNKA